jgi:hypothetical protein
MAKQGINEMQECRNARMQECRASRVAAIAILAFLHSCILALLVVVLTSRVAIAETIDRVLAVVAGDLITLSDVNAATELGLVTPSGGADPVRDVLSQLINRELELVEVERYAQPEPTADAVDAEVQMIRARFATPQAFAAVLLRSGIDEQHLRGTLRENLRIRAYLDQRFATGAQPRQQLIDEWLAGLRRRAEILDVYAASR